MNIESQAFGEIVVDGVKYTDDIVIAQGVVARRDKSASKKLKANYGHTPLTENENIPWHGPLLVVGKGHHGALPITDGFRAEAQRRGVELREYGTVDACTFLSTLPDAQVNAVIHITC